MSGFFGALIYGYGAIPPPTPSEYIAYSGSATAGQTVGVYPWDSTTGFGTLYSNPSAITSITVQEISFVRDNSLISASFSTSPYLYAWPWSASGYGTRYANPSSLLSPTGTPVGFTWTNAIDAILTFNQSSPSYPQAWAWSSGFGTKYTNGSVITNSGATYGISLNGDNTLVAFNFSATPYVALYPWSSASGFGTRYADPATSYTGNVIRQTISFNKVTNDLAVGSGLNPYVSAYAVSSSGFGSKYANPVADGFVKNSITFNQDGTYLATGTGAGTPIFVYPWSSGFGTKIFSPTSNTAVTVDWSSTGTEIAKSGGPITAWPWSAGFGTQYANPSTVASTPACVSFSNQSR
jgi:hypothetical protein